VFEKGKGHLKASHWLCVTLASLDPTHRASGRTWPDAIDLAKFSAAKEKQTVLWHPRRYDSLILL